MIFVFSDCRDIARLEIEASLVMESGGDINFEDIRFIPVNNFSVLHCAFSMRLMAEVVPNGSIFYAVVNPCEGEYERISGKTESKGIQFIGRNTGAFSWLLKDFGINEIYEYKDIPFTPFGGKRVYPQIISNLITGRDIEYLKHKKIYDGLIRDIELDNGTVVHIDNFGLIKIYTDPKLEISEGASYFVKNQRTDKKIEVTCKSRMMSGENNNFHIYYGSSLDGLIEIGAVRADIRDYFDVEVGDILNIS